MSARCADRHAHFISRDITQARLLHARARLLRVLNRNIGLRHAPDYADRYRRFRDAGGDIAHGLHYKRFTISPRRAAYST